MNYWTAKDFLSKGKSKTRRPLPGRSTEMLQLENGDIAIRYHATNVVTWHSNGHTTLTSEGFRTMTTKERINEYSETRVSQNSGLWYMPDGSLFYDGIQIDAKGKALNARRPEKTEGKKAKLDKLVSRYVKAFAAQIKKDGKLPEPGNGDCWYCLMVVSSSEEHKGKSLGEANGDVSHILEHLKERYIFGSILWRAIQRRGNPSVCWHIGNSYASRGETDFLMGDLRYYLRCLKPAMLELMSNR